MPPLRTDKTGAVYKLVVAGSVEEIWLRKQVGAVLCALNM
jgi:hypothetical protein